jgi:hypothetical protein
MRIAMLCVLIVSACDLPFSTGTRRYAGHIALSSATLQTQPSVPPPFVSVVDSISLIVTPSDDSPIVLGRQLTGRETTVSFPVEIPEGQVRVDATILSSNGTLLFDGTGTANVDGDDFVIPVSLTARSEVLVVAPDTARVTIPVPGRGQTTVRVYNRGNDLLDFGIQDTSQASRVQCASARCFVIRPRAGKILPESSLAVVIDSVRAFNNPIGLTVVSRVGEVVFVVRTQ